jgi:CheY-like chemotaxis protein
LVLPIRRPDDAEAAFTGRRRLPPRFEEPYNSIAMDDRPTVLLVNDDPDASEALGCLLEYEGYRVESAEDGRQALQKLNGGLRACVILLDLIMPGMDGYQFRAEQLKDGDLARIPVIVYSAAADAREAAVRLRAAAHLEVDDGLDRLLQLIEQHRLP